MKIKSVCEATGLTDRAIRYYIDEGLVSPAFTENYLGRRNFDFSEKDVDDLSLISVFRKYGFSISEIAEIKKRPERIPEIVNSLIQRKSALVSDESVLIASLEGAAAKRPSDAASLAELLRASELPSPDENAKLPAVKRALRIAHRILIIALALLPLVCGLISLNDAVSFSRYPVIRPICIVISLLLLTPSVILLLLPLIKKNSRWKRTACIILCVLTVLSVPLVSIFSFGVVSHSETHDYFRYLEVDERIAGATGNELYKFFPTETHFYKVVDGERVDLGKYLYRNLPAWNYTYDICAEWQDSNEELDAEIERITQLFEAKANENTWWSFRRLRRGNYDCLILYHGNEPFTAINDSYTYYIFAYDKSGCSVRYILCDSLEHSDEFQPYYLELDWE